MKKFFLMIFAALSVLSCQIDRGDGTVGPTRMKLQEFAEYRVLHEAVIDSYDLFRVLYCSHLYRTYPDDVTRHLQWFAGCGRCSQKGDYLSLEGSYYRFNAKFNELDFDVPGAVYVAESQTVICTGEDEWEIYRNDDSVFTLKVLENLPDRQICVFEGTGYRPDPDAGKMGARYDFSLLLTWMFENSTYLNRDNLAPVGEFNVDFVSGELRRDWAHFTFNGNPSKTVVKTSRD